ncbi:MAG: tRNA pseudouridine(55) synthase TruB [Rickettsiales bacterium]|jgi:tRNA pseudouridine55 synthase|nr:tRNA pseudouridine(55) synthase TruB [Rickettsiales bacterium]
MADGFILLDKPSGITSRQAGGQIAKMFGEKKFGHIGTLDPMASGLIVIALGEATKMIPFLEAQGAKCKEQSKEYLFSIKWGIRTDTGDITGNIADENGKSPPIDEIRKILPKLVGEYEQTPPAFSAKKLGGIPAYALARKGAPVKLKPVRILISELRIANCESEADDAVYIVRCGAGTYVRSLIQDIVKLVNSEKFFGTASMIRRTKTNGFSIENAAALDFFEKMFNNSNALRDFLKPLDFGLADIPVAKLESGDINLFSHGGVVSVQNGDGPVRVYSGEKFIGMGEVENKRLKPKRIIKCR